MLLAVLGAGVAASAIRSGAPASSVVREQQSFDAPLFALPGLVDPGATVRLSDHRGVPVVVNFWASWCVPCRKEMPALARVSAELSRQVDFIGVDHQDLREDALELLRDSGVRYPTGFDPEGKTAAAFALRGMPTTVFISADGQVLATSLGELTEAELRSAIVELFDISDD